MVRGMNSPAVRRGPLVTGIAAVLVITAAGAAAIVNYASSGRALAAHDSRTARSLHSGDGARYRAVTVGRTAKRSAAAPPSGPQRPGHRGAAAASPPVSAPTSSPSVAGPDAAGPGYFRTLPPGAKLPSGAQCARWVRAAPSPEVRSSNRVANHTIGEHVGRGFLSDDGSGGERLARRIDGDFTGTTQEILRWAACKWGIDQDLVFAQAAIESWWRQGTLGDWGNQASLCPPGHGLGADGTPGQCPQSYGILQNRYPYEQQSWPGVGRSTAMNADTAYAIWRACFDGSETWLNTVDRGSQYHAGDAWGCIGRWFAGRWRTAAADGYIVRVRQYLRERIWTTPDFKAAH